MAVMANEHNAYESEIIMKLDDIRHGQRIRVNVPGIGDHGQVGTVTRVQGIRCFVHLDWDQRPRHSVMFYAADLEHVPDELPPSSGYSAAGLTE